ncbi:GumC family protein [Methylobacterium iners]|uniref:Tyrosine-protein kinase G-rich domain-containing protein n=1 Tax=Methylobacterium iners TaxID=418707 RepID=A0ABQ4S4U2_9HYPH|nr:exopolysaccharide transport family protein [Methylobacterium iners]GJD97417.1 hypothetical protein OCOJLMKI_4647 [Methylobacterium iners]
MPRSTLHPAQAPAAQPAREGLKVSQIGGPLRRSALGIALATTIAGLSAFAFVQVVPPRYTGEAKVLLESREASFARSAQERSEPALPIDEQAVASQVQVVMSRDLAREAIRRLNLVGNPEFDGSVEGIGPVKRALMAVSLAQNPLERPAEDRVLEAYFDRLLVYSAGKSRILTIEFRSRDAELAARAANTVAELYIVSLEAAKIDTARYASTWLGGNIETLRSRVAEAEAKVEAFRARNGLITTGVANQPLNAQQLAELSSQLSQARSAKADLTARARLIKEMIKDGRAFEIPDVANNETIRRTVEQRITLRAQLALESRTLLSEHPRIKELTAQVADLDAQIKATAERVVRTMENEAKLAEARVEALGATVDGQRDTVAKGNSSEVQLRALEREAKAQREQLESYLSRYREASARDAENAAPADARVVSRAVVPELPSFPKKLPIVGLATLMGFLLSAGLVLGRHLLTEPAEPMRRREPEVGAPSDEPPGRPEPVPFVFPEASPALARPAAPMRAEPREPPPIAATLETPEAPRAAEPATAMPAPAPVAREASSAYHLDPLIERLRSGKVYGGRRVLVAETVPVKGGQGLAESLARTLAAGARTLLVDLNGRTGGADEPGLTDLVAGEAGFFDVIQSFRDCPLHGIARGSIEAEILIEEAEALGITLDALAEAYDWIVCRLDAAQTPAHDILSATAGRMAAVVIASNAEADDPDLLALYAAAEDAGAGQVLVAQDRAAIEAAKPVEPEMQLRLSAA